LKKPTGSVRFFKSGTEPKKPEKTEPNRKNRAKPKTNQAKTEPNRFEQVFVLKNQTEPIRNQSV
jgi:hypothetical protein